MNLIPGVFAHFRQALEKRMSEQKQSRLVPHNGYMVVKRDLEMEKTKSGLYVATPGKPEMIWGEVLELSAKPPTAALTESVAARSVTRTEQLHDFSKGQVVFFYRPSAVEVVHRGEAFWLIRAEDVMGHVEGGGGAQ